MANALHLLCQLVSSSHFLLYSGIKDNLITINSSGDKESPCKIPLYYIIIIIIIIIIMLYHSSCHWSIPYQQVVTYHLSIPQFFTEFQQILTVLISVMIECLVQCGGLPNTSVGYYRESTVSRVPIIIGVILTLCNC